MSNLNLNKAILAGHLVADPELKQTQSGISVLSFTLAVNRRYVSKSTDNTQSQQTDFIRMVAWRQTAEFIGRYFRKGSALCVVGSIQTRTWTDNQGQKNYATEIVVDEAMFVDSKGDSPRQGANPSAYTPDAYSPSYSSMGDVSTNFEEIKTDDDLPF